MSSMQSGKHVHKLINRKISAMCIVPDCQTGKILRNESDQFKLPRAPFKGHEILNDNSSVGGGFVGRNYRLLDDRQQRTMRCDIEYKSS